MDLASQTVRLPCYRRKYADPDGRGVVVGVVDSGIQSDHSAFANRIARVWDQTLPGPGVREGRYGTELEGADLARSVDETGHGTHVAGIAAGAVEPYLGVAPAATLVVVKTDLESANIADGVRYVSRIATELDMPVVINLSLGGQADAHDGTDPLSAIIDSETGEGRIVCCAAGNEGAEDVHAETLLLPDAVGDIEFWVPGSAPGEVVLDVWFSGQDHAEVAVADPRGVQTPFCQLGRSLRYDVDGGEVAVLSQRNPANGDHNVVVFVRAHSDHQTPAMGTWRLRIRGLRVVCGEVHAWMVAESGSVRFRGAAVSDRMKIGSPGSASSAVTVASFTTRNAWQDRSGRQHQSSFPPDSISPFSSNGPLRNHAPKPDVAAPGAFLAASMSTDASEDPRWIVADGYCVKAGTSMACPVVAGMVALLLQQNPTLDPATAKRLLRRASTIPGQPPDSFHTAWGYGFVDARRL